MKSNHTDGTDQPSEGGHVVAFEKADAFFAVGAKQSIFPAHDGGDRIGIVGARLFDILSRPEDGWQEAKCVRRRQLSQN